MDDDEDDNDNGDDDNENDDEDDDDRDGDDDEDSDDNSQRSWEENDIEYDEPGHHLPVLHHASQHMPWNDKSVFEEYDNDYFEKNYYADVPVKLPCKDRGKLATWRTPVRREVKGQNFAVLFQPDK